MSVGLGFGIGPLRFYIPLSRRRRYRRRGRVNHRLHFWLTVLTGGGWLFVWIPVAIRGGRRAR